MSTPLYDALRAHIRRDPAPFHMPGHKGRDPYGDWGAVYGYDLTELSDTGDLYRGEDAISAAEDLWARAWGFGACQFLTGGSTQGLQAALLLAARRGTGAAVDRCCHRSVYHGLGLWGLEPVYLLRRQDEPIRPDELASALESWAAEGKEIHTVCITSPTYYGVLSDIQALAEVCHRRGARLLVDGAHGCHLPFLPGWEGYFRGADWVVASAHKTLFALGQGAVLLAREAGEAADLRWAASVTGTSSPSYPVMASLDRARDWAESPAGRDALRETARRREALRRDFPALADGTDPLRLTLTVDRRKAPGGRVAALLEEAGVYPEMADRDHLVFLLSPMNTEGDYHRLGRALGAAADRWPGVFAPPSALEAPPLPPAPQVARWPREALLAPRERVALGAAAGRVAAEAVAPYPPGVPVVAPGEVFTEKSLAYLREIGYNGEEPVAVWAR